MAKARSLVGLDVHATKVVAAVLDAETGQLQTFAMSGENAKVAAFCGGLPRPVRAAYEAGPTGYGLARELAKRGVECVVAAPSKIPRASGDRVKTDRRDAEHLVRLLLAGKLHAVRVPGDEEEALRDLVRARDAVRMDLMRCRHRLSKLLLRHGIRFDDGAAWTARHRQWLATVTLEWPAAQTTLLDAQGAIDALAHRRDSLEREIIAMPPTSPWALQVGRLRCLRGVETLHVLTSRPINLVELALIHHAAGQELGSHASHKVGSEAPPRMSRRVDVGLRLNADIDQPGSPEQLRKTTANERVSPVVTVNLQEELDQPVPSCTGWVTYRQTDIRFQTRDPTTRPGESDHLGDSVLGIGNVDQQRAGMDEVKGGLGQTGTPGVALHDLYVRRRHARGERLCRGDVVGIDLDAGHAACRTDAVGQDTQRAAGPTPEIDRVPSRADADLVKQRRAVSTQLF